MRSRKVPCCELWAASVRLSGGGSGQFCTGCLRWVAWPAAAEPAFKGGCAPGPVAPPSLKAHCCHGALPWSREWPVGLCVQPWPVFSPRQRRRVRTGSQVGDENQPPQQGQLKAQDYLPLEAAPSEPPRGAAPGAKHQRRSAGPPMPLAPAAGGRATPAAAPAAPPKDLSWSEQRYGQPQLDYG